MINGGSASALETRGVTSILGSDNSPFVYEWGVAGMLYQTGLSGHGSGHVTRYDPESQTRRDTLILRNFAPRFAGIDESANRMILVQEDRTAVVAVDLDTLEEAGRRALGPLPGTVVGRFADSSSGAIWLICRRDPELVFVEIRMDTLDYGRSLVPSEELTAVGATVAGPPGIQYILGTGNPRGIFVFDSAAGGFVKEGVLDLGTSTMSRALYIPQLDQLAISAVGANPRLHVFDADTLDPVLSIPTPVGFYGGLFYREQDGLLYGAGSQIPTTLVALDPVAGNVAQATTTAYDLTRGLGSFGGILDIVYNPILDMATYATSEQAMGSFPGGSLDMTPSRAMRDGARQVVADPVRGRIWVIGTVSSSMDWIEQYDAETMEVLGSIERSTTQGAIASARVDEASGDLQLEVRSAPRRVIHVHRDTMAIEERANLEYTATSSSTRATLAVALTGELYAGVPTVPPRMLRFPADSNASDAGVELPEGTSIVFMGHDEVLGQVFVIASDANGRWVRLFDAGDLSVIDSHQIDGWVTGSTLAIDYHRARREVAIVGHVETGVPGVAAISIDDGSYRIVGAFPSGYGPLLNMDYDDDAECLHLILRSGNQILEWLSLDLDKDRLKSRGIIHQTNFGLQSISMIKHGSAPKAVAVASGSLRVLEGNRPLLRPFDLPASRVYDAGQSFAVPGSSKTLISRQYPTAFVAPRRAFTPSFIEITDWKTGRILDRPVGIVTGGVASLLQLPTTPAVIAVAANAQFIEVSLLDAETMEETHWKGLDSVYGEAVWMQHDPVGNHLVLGTLLEGGGGYLLALDAESLDLIAEYEFAPGDGTPLVGAVDSITGDIVVGLDGTDPAVARFAVPALSPSGEIVLEGLGLPSRGGMAVDGDGRRVYCVLRPQGRRVAIDLESFGIQASAQPATNLPPIWATTTYEMTLNPETGLGYVAGNGDIGLFQNRTIRIDEFRLDDCQSTRSANAMDPMSSFHGGPRSFALAYDFEDDLIVLGGSYFNHAAFRNLINKTPFTVTQRVSADAIRFYSHAADGELNFGIYTRGTGTIFRERVWESGPVANTVEGDFLTVPVESGEGNPVILEPGLYFLTWRTNSHKPVGSFAPLATPGSMALPLPFEEEAAMMPHRLPNMYALPWTIGGAWTHYLEATPVVEPLTGWAIY